MLFDELERVRLEKMLHYEREGWLKGFKSIAGIDEAGRGPLAGPVVAAACILPSFCYLPYLNDSKVLSVKKREGLFKSLTNDPLIIYGVGIICSEVIDQVNIYEATKLAMQQAVDKLSQHPDYLLVDGMPLSYKELPALKIIKGDQLSQSIAAASIIAKETRDQLMRNYHLKWPMYGFDKHKGYGTKQHLKAIDEYGACAIHRRSFEPIKSL